MQAIEQQEQEAENPPKNWYLIVFRWILLLILIVCVCLNTYNSVFHIDMVTYYSTCGECTFVLYESLVLSATLGIICLLLLGIYLVLMQKTRSLRIYNMVFFLCTWLQMLLILVLTQRFPISHAVHYKWVHQKSLAFYEKTYDCCGVLGPDDYLLTSGSLPSSCFHNDSRRTKDLHYNGCMNKDIVSPTFLRYELLTSLIQLVLVVGLLLYYLYLKKKALPARSCRDLCRACIIL